MARSECECENDDKSDGGGLRSSERVKIRVSARVRVSAYGLY